MLETFRYRPFGILRFTLALMVLTQHFASDIAPAGVKQLLYPFALGNIAVFCFFILSGFIICEAYHFNYKDRPFAYLQNRVMRIVPTYWAALFLSILTHFTIFQYYEHLSSLDRHEIGSDHFGLPNLLKNVFAIIPPIQVHVTDTDYPFIPYAWALQTEMMFYLTVFLVGVAYPYLRRLNSWPEGYWLALAGVLGIAVGAGVQLQWLPKQLAFGSYFAFGGAVYFVISGHRKALLVMIPALFQMLWHFHTSNADDFTTIPANRFGQLAIFIIILISIIVLAKLRLQNVKFDKWVGELSYPLYLNHYIIGVVVLNTVCEFSNRYLMAGVVGSLLLTWVMFRLVDKPLIKVRRAIRLRNTRMESMVSADP